MKKTLVLSLSMMMLLSTGCSSATGGEEGPSNSASSAIQSTPNTSEQGTHSNADKKDLPIEEQVVKTLSDYYELAGSQEAKDLAADLDAAIVSGDNQKSARNMDKAYEKHAEFLNQLEQKISIPTGESLISANARNWGLSDRGIERMDYLNAASQISEINSGAERGIPAIFPDSIVEENGEVSVLARHVYLKDDNGAIRERLPIQYGKFVITDGGKKLELAQSDEYARSVANSILESDVQNAAKVVETYRVYAGYKPVPLVVENGKIVPTEAMGNEEEYVLKTSPDTNLRIEGTSDQYTITATMKDYDGEVVYNSSTGGLQNSDFMGYDKTDSYDAKLFRNYLTTVGNFDDVTEAVERLNAKYEADGTNYEVIEKDGERYIKVTDPQSVLAKDGDLLYVFIPDRF